MISIVIPYYNEGNTINELIKSIKCNLQNDKYECIIINDFSDCRNTTKLIEMIYNNTNFFIINNSSRLGQHRSIIKGIEIAKGSYILVMSADLQEDLTIIPKMIMKSKNYDLVYGKRTNRADNNFFSVIANYLMHFLINSAYPKQGFDYYIFCSKYKYLFNRKEFIFPQLTLVNHITDSSFIPYSRRKRVYGKSKWNFNHKFLLFFKILYKYIFIKYKNELYNKIYQ